HEDFELDDLHDHAHDNPSHIVGIRQYKAY
ncbi:MAG: hypothetical protein RJB42_1744, partial [Bacteroidota bacterium]